MDEIVLRGVAKWPNVPAVYGWLSLDRRGEWLVKGSRISNPTVTAFIGRNYEFDERGCWFFQNGPQRVFVGLDYTPFIYRVVSGDGGALELECHTRQAVASVEGAWLDETGALLLLTERGIGLVHDRDLGRLPPHFTGPGGRTLDESALDALTEALHRGRAAPLYLKHRGSTVKVGTVASHEVPRRFGFVAQPAPHTGEEACR